MEKELLTAEYMRKYAKQHHEDLDEENLKSVVEAMYKTAEKGENFCYYNGDIRLGVQRKLSELGYALTYCSDYPKSGYEISWEDEK